MLAWKLYSDDFQDIMVPNAPLGAYEPAGLTIQQGFWCPPEAESWIGSGNPDVNTDVVYCASFLLGPYLVKQMGALRCPADNIDSKSASGGSEQRIRSVSMNSQMGTFISAVINRTLRQ